ncbi:MAG: chemotaxis protein CheD [Mizugakiibacter sp.]|uniref:chemotaxis protein CheD n=1 Tax=Mizugakiibacter sp. TaxID=1972610 RepID=UPI0031BCB81F|nr:chemotaxis protein CheD [Xanthomonadaceae bacterium]
MRGANRKTDIFLQPGDHFVGGDGYRIRTLLGSCVSITLWHPATRTGAMSHFLLSRRGEFAAAETEADGRYGEEALTLMLRELRHAGVRTTECQAKIFGGGNMFPDRATANVLDIGRRNGETARALLQLHRIPIVSESLFGAGHRQVVFDIESGHVWSRQVHPADPFRRGGSPT